MEKPEQPSSRTDKKIKPIQNYVQQRLDVYRGVSNVFVVKWPCSSLTRSCDQHVRRFDEDLCPFTYMKDVC